MFVFAYFVALLFLYYLRFCSCIRNCLCWWVCVSRCFCCCCFGCADCRHSHNNAICHLPLERRRVVLTFCVQFRSRFDVTRQKDVDDVVVWPLDVSVCPLVCLFVCLYVCLTSPWIPIPQAYKLCLKCTGDTRK